MILNSNLKLKISNLPTEPGVYYFYNKYGRILYVGKASVLKNRVKSYFIGVHDNKTEVLVSQISDIKYQVTDSVLESIILETNEIKRLKPKYNIREKDDKSYNYIFLTGEEYPRFFIERAPWKDSNIKISQKFGPFTSGLQAKAALQILRRIFGFRDCNERKFNLYQKRQKPCLFFALNLCFAPCTGKIDKKTYHEIILEIKEFLTGKKKNLIKRLEQQMNIASRHQKYELAVQIRNKIQSLQYIQDVALIKKEKPFEQYRMIPKRIEAYDISNLPAGRQAYLTTGSMIVFTSGQVDKSQYRKFRIKNYELRIKGQNDPAMLAEIIERRFNHPEWTKPDLIILDGGKGQLSAVLKVLREKSIKIPVIAVAKGPSRKGYRLFKNALAEKIILDKKFIESIRDEAHRFAISYHRKLRARLTTIIR